MTAPAQQRLTADPAVARTWIETLFGHAGSGHFGVSAAFNGTLTNRFFPVTAEGIDAAIRQIVTWDSRSPQGIYLQSTLLGEQPPPGKRGGEAAVQTVTHFWFDGDYGTEGHKPGLDDLPHPPDAETILRIRAESPLPDPTGYGWSGGGGNGVWMLAEPYTITGEEDRARIKALTVGWQKIAGAAAYRAGFTWDIEVGNLDRLMRAIGTIWRKVGYAERPTSIGAAGGAVYELADIEKVVAESLPDAEATLAQAAKEKQERRAKRLGYITPPPRPPRRNEPALHSGDGPLDVLADTMTFADVLLPHGWTFQGTHSDGREAWLRPAADGDRASSPYSLLCNDHVAINWSDRADLPVGPQAPGYKLTVGTVFAHLNYNGDTSEAARDVMRAAAGHQAGGAGRLPQSVLDEVRRRCLTESASLQSAASAPPIDWSDAAPRNQEVAGPEQRQEEATPEDEAKALSTLFVTGGAFVLDVPETPPAVWGEGGDVLWAEGEALMIAAPQGVGKTTLAFQVVRARLGLQDTVLGLPVVPGKRVLYLAMDRPAQAQRAANRLFGGDDRSVLDDRLIVWKGPPPFDMAKQTSILAAMCEKAGADTVVVDSLKDAAIGLSDDAVGAAYNRARQQALSAGVQVLELHHNRKAGANGGEPNTLSDVYGSVWIPSGTGSVISLFGEAGDPVVSFRHLKQPMNEVGPFQVVHDHPTGISTVMHTTDIFELVKIGGPEGLTALRAAETLYDAKKPTLAQKEKARRKLDKLVESGHLVKHDGPTKTSPATYYLGAIREAS